MGRGHDRERSRAAVEFQRLPNVAHRRDAADRCPCDQERRASRRHRRDWRNRRPTRFAQRDLCGNRRPLAPSADRSRRHCCQEGVAAMRRTVILVVAAIIIAVGVFAWRTFARGPLAFAGGSTIALADYREANPTGVPASLAQADIVKRGEYLAKAADCVVCHTTKDGDAFAGGLPFPAPSGTLYSTNITADKDTGIGNYTDQDFLNAVQSGVRKDGARLYPAMPYTSYT